MFIHVSQTGQPQRGDSVLLEPVEWDDFFKFETLYTAYHVEANGHKTEIGLVKIGEEGLRGSREAKPGFRRPTLPRRFGSLQDNQFSLGQDAEYYVNLNKLGAPFRDSYLRAMRDIAWNRELIARYISEDVVLQSLLREVSLHTVQEQFARIARGGDRLTSFQLKVRIDDASEHSPIFEAHVHPESKPPTNIHALIGRNGVGKTRLLRSIASSFSDRGPEAFANRQIANVIHVSYSGFDQSEELQSSRVTFMGHEDPGWNSSRVRVVRLENWEVLRNKLENALMRCLVGSTRRIQLVSALETLESDPNFRQLGLSESVSGDASDNFIAQTLESFNGLSSGHKMVLVTIASLVAYVEEKTLVLFDEPEAHLHPPLLSALVRALSQLLTAQNGIAIAATHSPVVLQEVPRSCVWKLNRIGQESALWRPRIETFGENVGSLTDEVFGLEVTATGYHNILREILLGGHSYAQTLEILGEQLGTEGRAVLRALAMEMNTSRVED